MESIVKCKNGAIKQLFTVSESCRGIVFFLIYNIQYIRIFRVSIYHPIDIRQQYQVMLDILKEVMSRNKWFVDLKVWSCAEGSYGESIV